MAQLNTATLHSIVLDGDHAEREARAQRRTRQADILSRFDAMRIVEDDTLREVFRKDDSIAAFWRRAHHARRQAWGPQLDIRLID